MTEADITKEVMRGRLVVVGELRGTHAESAGYVDRRTGETIKYVRVIYLIECACRGMLDRAVVTTKVDRCGRAGVGESSLRKRQAIRVFSGQTPPNHLSAYQASRFQTHAEPRRGDVATTTE
jgi:hypothetical protein